MSEPNDPFTPPSGYSGPPPGYSGQPSGTGNWPPGPPAGPPPRRRRGPWLAAGAIVAVCILVAVGIIVAVVWPHHGSSSHGPLAKGQLTKQFPTEPSRAWTTSAAEFGARRFSRLPKSADPRDPGYAHDDRYFVAALDNQDDSPRQLVGLDTQTGRGWRGPSVLHCAQQIINGLLPCIGEAGEPRQPAEVIRVRVTDGKIAQTTTLPAGSGATGVAAGRSGIFVAYPQTGGQLTVARLASSGKPSWSTTVPLHGDDFSPVVRAAGSLISVYSGESSVLLNADTGTLLWDKPGYLSQLTDEGTAIISPYGGSAGETIALTADGRQTNLGSGRVSSIDLAAPSSGHLVFATEPDGGQGRVVDDRTGRTAWEPPGGAPGPVSLITDSVAVTDAALPVEGATARCRQTAWDIQSSTQMWSTTKPCSPSVTDGSRLISYTPDDFAIHAVNLLTGQQEWTHTPNVDRDNDIAGELVAVGSRLIVIGNSAIEALPATGGDAIPLGDADNGSNGQDDSYATRCDSSPIFTAENFSTGTSGLVVHMKVIATCAKGDVLAAPQTSLTIKDGTRVIASGIFDFAKTPTGIPGSDSGTKAVTMDLTFPPGSYDSASATSITQGSNSGQYQVGCDRQGTPSTDRAPISSGRTPTAATATGPGEGAPSTATMTFPAMQNFVVRYYSLLPGQPDQAWPLLDSGYASRTGLANFGTFWSSVRRVEVLAVQPRTDDSVVAQLRYTMNDGTVMDENRWLSFDLNQGHMLIFDSDRVGPA